MAKHTSLVLTAILGLAGIGCNVTHPRTSPDLEALISKPKRIALLRPELAAKVKYIKTKEFFLSPKYSADYATSLTTGYRRVLERDEHTVIREIEIRDLLPEGDAALDKLSRDLIALVEKAIVADPDYSSQNVPLSVNGKELIPDELRERVDFIVATKGRLMVETTKEWYARWGRNIGLNLLTLPISLVSTFIPITLPLSVNISTSIFESSPEEMFIAMIIIDCRDGGIIYQNDVTSRDIPGDQDDCQELAEDLLDEFIKAD